MSKHFNPRIKLEAKYVPYKWQEKLVREQKLGGVMLIFLEGKTKKEIKAKEKEIKSFCKELNKKPLSHLTNQLKEKKI